MIFTSERIEFSLILLNLPWTPDPVEISALRIRGDRGLNRYTLFPPLHCKSWKLIENKLASGGIARPAVTFSRENLPFPNLLIFIRIYRLELITSHPLLPPPPPFCSHNRSVFKIKTRGSALSRIFPRSSTGIHQVVRCKR